MGRLYFSTSHHVINVNEKLSKPSPKTLSSYERKHGSLQLISPPSAQWSRDSSSPYSLLIFSASSDLPLLFVCSSSALLLLFSCSCLPLNLWGIERRGEAGREGADPELRNSVGGMFRITHCGRWDSIDVALIMHGSCRIWCTPSFSPVILPHHSRHSRPYFCHSRHSRPHLCRSCPHSPPQSPLILSSFSSQSLLTSVHPLLIFSSSSPILLPYSTHSVHFF